MTVAELQAQIGRVWKKKWKRKHKKGVRVMTVADKIKYYENMLAKGVLVINTKQIINDLKKIKEQIDFEKEMESPY